MELNKKNKFAENVKNKILNLQEVIEKGKRQEQFMEDYVSMKYGYIDPNPDLYYTTEQFTILDKWEQNSYFTNDEIVWQKISHLIVLVQDLINT